MNWTEPETLSAFLEYREPQDGAHWVSCLIALLRDARVVTGRDVTTGEVEVDKQDLAGRWLGAVGYMTFFDQIGSAYRPGNVPELVFGPTFIKALRYFAPEIGEAEREALYALRCSFVHDYSLVNVPSQGSQAVRELRTHHFMHTAPDETGTIVRLPRQRWDGIGGNCRINNATWVNLWALGDLAETVFRRLAKLHETGDLEIALPGGLSELQRRYSMTVRPIRFVDP
ncbi:hypothetical protein QRX50_46775 [Amycolatopsis carbonis]|uniref:Uncharacterized protein n=1 Tax=Amycolatopsis carbonis TaxID=715471 RepID=A0A9Y2MVF5_9PSEU|nr:hypothetical protein [Amycolatopsis sp. 2-15]WIX78758.1 hypothetical protein QRX50_46775 [Amycolatopsis sp. 2-15]